MRKTTKIDFFIVSDDTAADLEIILTKLSNTPPESAKRTIEHQEDWMRLSRAEPGKDGFFGDMMRISMGPPGFRANLDGEIEPLLFKSDEGLAENAAFYFDYDSQILTLQRNSKAVSFGQFEHYLKRVSDESEINLLPILRPTSVSKVRTLHQIRKLHISANIIDVMPTLDDIDNQTKLLIQNAMLAESPSIEVILKASRDKESSLNESIVVETIESWMKIQDNFADDENQIVKKMVVTGKEDSGERIEFDLLKDRVFTQMVFDWEPNVELLWENRQKQIQQAWDLNHKNLKKYSGR